MLVFAYLFSVLVHFTNFEILCWLKKIYSRRASSYNFRQALQGAVIIMGKMFTAFSFLSSSFSLTCLFSLGALDIILRLALLTTLFHFVHFSM